MGDIRPCVSIAIKKRFNQLEIFGLEVRTDHTISLGVHCRVHEFR